jgi:tetratricopeptide (TPR) repeat protein
MVENTMPVSRKADLRAVPFRSSLGTGPQRVRLAAAVLMLSATFSSSSTFVAMASSQPDREGRENSAFSVIADAPVDFQDILNDPDNVDLNLRFARERIAQGNLQSAASTLERLLLRHPQLDRVRLLNAYVLGRLGNSQEAAIQLDRIDEDALLPNERVEAQDLRRSLRSDFQGTTGRLSIGTLLRYDTNRRARPDQNRVEVVGGTFDFSGLDGGDASLGLSFDGAVDHDLGFQAGHGLFARLQASGRAQDRLSNQGFGFGRIELGGVYRMTRGELQPFLIAENTWFGGENYGTGLGAGLRATAELTPALSITAELRVRRDLARDISFARSGSERSGHTYRARLGMDYAMAPGTSLRVTTGVDRRDARANYRSHDTLRASVDLRHSLASGQFVSGHASAAGRVYGGNDLDRRTGTPISERTRRDGQYRLRATYGISLDRVFDQPALADILSGLTVAASADYFRQASNIDLYSYENLSVETRLTKTIRF